MNREPSQGLNVLANSLLPGGSGLAADVPSLFQVRGGVFSRKIQYANLKLGTLLVTVAGWWPRGAQAYLIGDRDMASGGQGLPPVASH